MIKYSVDIREESLEAFENVIELLPQAKITATNNTSTPWEIEAHVDSEVDLSSLFDYFDPVVFYSSEEVQGENNDYL